MSWSQMGAKPACQNVPPEVAANTGSNTTGKSGCVVLRVVKKATRVSSWAPLQSMPILIAWIGSALVTESIWASSCSGVSANMSSTPAGDCAVTAVIAVLRQYLRRRYCRCPQWIKPLLRWSLWSLLYPSRCCKAWNNINKVPTPALSGSGQRVFLSASYWRTPTRVDQSTHQSAWNKRYVSFNRRF